MNLGHDIFSWRCSKLASCLTNIHWIIVWFSAKILMWQICRSQIYLKVRIGRIKRNTDILAINQEKRTVYDCSLNYNDNIYSCSISNYQTIGFSDCSVTWTQPVQFLMVTNNIRTLSVSGEVPDLVKSSWWWTFEVISWRKFVCDLFKWSDQNVDAFLCKSGCFRLRVRAFHFGFIDNAAFSNTYFQIFFSFFHYCEFFSSMHGICSCTN